MNRGKHLKEEAPDVLPFITSDKQTADGGKPKFRVHDEAIEALSAFREKFAVLAIAGPYRTGKSMLVNWLCLGSSKRMSVTPGRGFAVGHTVHACTQGVWMYRHLVPVTFTDPETGQVQTKHALILDSEGLGSVDAHVSESYDLQLFVLVLLLSSKFVYNSVGKIEEPTIAKLDMVVNVAQKLKINGEDTLGSLPAHLRSRFLPDLAWVLRDFSLALSSQSDTTRKISPTEYLNEVLDEIPGGGGSSSSSVGERNRARRTIKNTFAGIECFTLPHPCDSRYLSMLDTPQAQLRPEFIAQADQMRTAMLSSARLKSTNEGHHVTGATYAHFAQNLVQALNGGEMPTLGSQWSMLAQIQCRSLVDQGVSQFMSRCDALDLGLRAQSALVVENEMFRIANEVLGDYDKNAWSGGASGGASGGGASDGEEDSTAVQCKAELQSRIQKEGERMTTENRRLIEAYIDKDLIADYLEPRLVAARDYGEFVKVPYAKALETYTKTIGGEQTNLDIWARFFLSKALHSWPQQFFGTRMQRLAELEEACKRLETKAMECSELETKLMDTQAKLQAAQVELETSTVRIADHDVQMGLLHDAKTALQASNLKLRTEVMQLEVLTQERNLLQEEVSALRARLAAVETESGKSMQAHQQSLAQLQQTLTRQVQELKLGLQSTRQDLTASRAAQSELQATHSRTLRDYEQLQLRLQDHKRSLEESHKQFAAEKSVLQQSIDQKTQQMREDEQKSREIERRLQQDVMASNEKFTKLQTEYAGLKQRFQELDQKCKADERSTRKMESDLRAELEDKKILGVRDSTTIEMLTRRYDALRKEELAKHDRIQALEARLQQQAMGSFQDMFASAGVLSGSG